MDGTLKVCRAFEILFRQPQGNIQLACFRQILLEVPRDRIYYCDHSDNLQAE